jgi:hypothetical protein
VRESFRRSRFAVWWASRSWSPNSVSSATSSGAIRTNRFASQAAIVGLRNAFTDALPFASPASRSALDISLRATVNCWGGSPIQLQHRVEIHHTTLACLVASGNPAASQPGISRQAPDWPRHEVDESIAATCNFLDIACDVCLRPEKWTVPTATNPAASSRTHRPPRPAANTGQPAGVTTRPEVNTRAEPHAAAPSRDRAPAQRATSVAPPGVLAPSSPDRSAAQPARRVTADRVCA